MKFWNRQNYIETVKRSVVARDSGGDDKRVVKLFYMKL